MTRRTVYILAARHQFFVDWCAEHGINPRDNRVRFVSPSSNAALHGTRGVLYTVIGPAASDPDMRHLEEVVRTYDGRRMTTAKVVEQLAEWDKPLRGPEWEEELRSRRDSAIRKRDAALKEIDNIDGALERIGA
jgi:hypothetical protein